MHKFILRRRRTNHHRINIMHIFLHLAPLQLPCTSILLANMSVIAVYLPALALPWTRTAFQHVLQHMTRLGLELIVVKGAAEGCACALEVEVVAWLLLAEAVVVDLPFFECGRADVGVEALIVSVDGDEAWYYARW
jgi:hypothetical protein